MGRRLVLNYQVLRLVGLTVDMPTMIHSSINHYKDNLFMGKGFSLSLAELSISL